MKRLIPDGTAFIRTKATELLHEHLEPIRLQLGSVQCATIARSANVHTDAEFKVFSQWGEDGIIEYLVQRLPGIPRSFVEFGVEDYSESSTRFLLMNRLWRGLIIDGGDRHIEFARRRLGWRYPVTAVSNFVTRENIREILSLNSFDRDLGLLSIDIDGNDYWIWETIDTSAWIVVCEYNAVFGAKTHISVPYSPDFSRLKHHHSGLYFGASLGALEHLAKRKGYQLIGTNRAGNNAFFVREDVGTQLRTSTSESAFTDSTFAESRDANGKLTYLTGRARSQLINNLPVVDVRTGETVTLAHALTQSGEAP